MAEVLVGEMANAAARLQRDIGLEIEDYLALFAPAHQPLNGRILQPEDAVVGLTHIEKVDVSVLDQAVEFHLADLALEVAAVFKRALDQLVARRRCTPPSSPRTTR
jgi:hypothetical protein